MTKLHQYLDADVLPKTYGGTLPEINYSGKDWFPCVHNYEQHIAEWNTYGFKK